MKFADFMCESAICVDVKATDKIGVIQELVGSLVSAGQVKEEDRDSIVEAIMKREELGSTGIGRGVAVPHTKHSSVDSLIGTVGVSAEGVEFEVDGEPVLLFCCPHPDRPGDHLRALENISRQLRRHVLPFSQTDNLAISPAGWKKRTITSSLPSCHH